MANTSENQGSGPDREDDRNSVLLVAKADLTTNAT